MCQCIKEIELYEFVLAKIEPKLSTILCYRSPREKKRKLSKVPRHMSKSMNDIGGSLKSASATKRARAYRPSNRYGNLNTMKRSVTNISDTRDDVATSSLSCARTVTPCADFLHSKNETNKKENKGGANNTPIKRDDKKRVFLNKTTSCHEIGKTCDKKEVVGADAKILHLTGPSPRSCYVRRHVTELITYKRHSTRECRIKTISNETKHITSTSNSNNSVMFKEEKKRCKDNERAEVVFDIVTRDMRRMHLRPMQLKDPRTMLLCLENYLDIKTN